jgi:hypothetical protein
MDEMMNMLKSFSATCEIINYKSATSLMVRSKIKSIQRGFCFYIK